MKNKRKRTNNTTIIKFSSLTIVTSSRTNFSPNDWWKWVTRLRQKGGLLRHSFRDKYEALSLMTKPKTFDIEQSTCFGFLKKFQSIEHEQLLDLVLSMKDKPAKAFCNAIALFEGPEKG